MDWIQRGPTGQIFDTSGPLRVEPRGEAHFVVGRGIVQLVPSIHDGNQLIRDIRNHLGTKETHDDSTISYSNDHGWTVVGLLPGGRV